MNTFNTPINMLHRFKTLFAAAALMIASPFSLLSTAQACGIPTVDCHMVGDEVVCVIIKTCEPPIVK